MPGARIHAFFHQEMTRAQGECVYNLTKDFTGDGASSRERSNTFQEEKVSAVSEETTTV